MLRLFRALAALLLLLVIALVSALITMRLAIHGAEVRVPDLAGQTLPDAAARLHARGLETAVDGHYYSTAQPAGHVLTQSPTAGTLVRKSWRVRLTISLGPQKVAIPAVDGMDTSIATITIRRTGLKMGDIVALPYEYAPPNTVVAQTPVAHATDVEGPKVGILMALAPPPSENTIASVMPDLTGEPYTEAALAVIHAGFTLAPLPNAITSLQPGSNLNSARSSAALPTLSPLNAQPTPYGIPSGTVVSQNPAAGSRVAAGTSIQLTVQP